MTVVLWVLVIALCVLGFVGLVVPMLPDILLILTGFLLYHYFIDATTLTAPFWWTVGIFTVLLLAFDYIASALGAKKFGASKWSLISAALGLMIFPFFLGPMGILVGPFVMVMITERICHKSLKKAVKIGFGSLAGFVGGLLVKGMVMLFLVATFLWKVLV